MSAAMAIWAPRTIAKAHQIFSRVGSAVRNGASCSTGAATSTLIRSPFEFVPIGEGARSCSGVVIEHCCWPPGFRGMRTRRDNRAKNAWQTTPAHKQIGLARQGHFSRCSIRKQGTWCRAGSSRARSTNQSYLGTSPDGKLRTGRQKLVGVQVAVYLAFHAYQTPIKRLPKRPPRAGSARTAEDDIVIRCYPNGKLIAKVAKGIWQPSRPSPKRAGKELFRWP